MVKRAVNALTSGECTDSLVCCLPRHFFKLPSLILCLNSHFPTQLLNHTFSLPSLSTRFAPCKRATLAKFCDKETPTSPA